MMYQIGDKFVVHGILCEVRVINRGKAWVCPLDDTPSGSGHVHLNCVTLEVLDENGIDRKGNKALVVNNSQSGAV